MSNNSGVQITNGNYNAEVSAVGTGASATKITGSDPRVAAALDELRGAVEKLSLSAQQKQILSADVAQIDAAAKEGNATAAKSGLQSLADKLRMAGVVVKETLSLAGPLATLAGVVGTSLAALGL